MTRQRIARLFEIIWIAPLIAIVAATAWVLLGTSISNHFTKLTSTICTPSRCQLILVPRPYPPGFEPVLLPPEPPRGWHYRPDLRLETDAQ